ncbi:MAG TPA: hypothetical protein VI385_15740 [Flavisolibacter sp.]
MISITFFVFVGLIIVVGFFAATWRKKNRVPLDPDGEVERDNGTSISRSHFSESRDKITGGILPADNKMSQNDLDESEEPMK